MKLQDRAARMLIEGLKKTELKSTSRKYRKFSGREEGHFYFVGKAGAVRSGKNASNSYSITAQFHSNMKLWEKKNGLKC